MLHSRFGSHGLSIHLAGGPYYILHSWELLGPYSPVSLSSLTLAGVALTLSKVGVSLGVLSGVSFVGAGLVGELGVEPPDDSESETAERHADVQTATTLPSGGSKTRQQQTGCGEHFSTSFSGLRNYGAMQRNSQTTFFGIAA